MSDKARTRVPGDGEAGKYCVDPLSGCGRYLTLDSFHRNKNNADGLKGRCKDCIHDYQTNRWEGRAASRKRAGEKIRKKTAGVTMAEAQDALQHYIDTGEVPPLIDEDLGTVDELLDKEI